MLVNEVELQQVAEQCIQISKAAWEKEMGGREACNRDAIAAAVSRIAVVMLDHALKNNKVEISTGVSAQQKIAQALLPSE